MGEPLKVTFLWTQARGYKLFVQSPSLKIDGRFACFVLSGTGLPWVSLTGSIIESASGL